MLLLDLLDHASLWALTGRPPSKAMKANAGNAQKRLGTRELVARALSFALAHRRKTGTAAGSQQPAASNAMRKSILLAIFATTASR